MKRSTYSHIGRGNGAAYKSDQVVRMEKMSRLCHPGMSKCSPRPSGGMGDDMEERTESMTERRRELKEGEEY